ncbi:MAG TPA: DEAD/DEAH box helicase [Rectinemataceae bacterium]|nr:DEAD/DEAH box helicase [Rectinemataceae bacterium]
MDFSELGLHPDLKRGLDEAGYITCMPVQEQVFAHAFQGEDIYAQSQTGTGKTAAFLISIFHRIMSVPDQRTRKVLILAPTRELAVQIETEAKRLGKYLPISAGSFYGGVSYGPQLDMLRSDVQMIIGTPGRIIDLLRQGKMLLKEVGFLVIDEADRMFDMGFIDDLRRLLRYLPGPQGRQTFLFSATLGLRVKDLAWEYMDNPKEIVIESEHITVELVTQELYHTGNHEKFRLLLGILDREKPKSALIFCNQKYMAEEVARRLRVNGLECEFIMGDLPQSKRLQIIDRLKEGKLEILVATDVAARGLDVEALDLVVNYDVPEEAESYVHRIGRTARAGKAGKAVTLACEKFVYGLPAIEKFVGYKIPTMPFDESLLLADRSAGMRFGHARDHGRLSPSGRGQHEGMRELRRGGKRRSDERQDERRGAAPRPDDRSGPRTGGERRGAAPQYEDGARRADTGARPAPSRSAQGAPARPAAPGTPPARQGAHIGEANPYALSQEERLRRYKEKYGDRDSARSGARNSESPRAGAGAAPGGAASGIPRGDGAGRAPGRRGGSQPRPGTPQKAPAPPASPKATSEGLLGRLRTILGRRNAPR